MRIGRTLLSVTTCCVLISQLQAQVSEPAGIHDLEPVAQRNVRQLQQAIEHGDSQRALRSLTLLRAMDLPAALQQWCDNREAIIAKLSAEIAVDAPVTVENSDIVAPSWAHFTGHDEFGCWAAWQIGRSVLRFRYVPHAGATHAGATQAGKQANAAPAGLWVAETPLTVDQWRSLGGTAPETMQGDIPFSGAKVSDIVTLLTSLADKGGPRLRLPSEQEWHLAASAGAEGDFQPWFIDYTHGSFATVRPRRIGQHPRNTLGLSEIHGGVWELCRAADGSLVRRGGSYRSSRADTALSVRYPVLHNAPDPTLGIRPVIDFQ